MQRERWILLVALLAFACADCDRGEGPASDRTTTDCLAGAAEAWHTASPLRTRLTAALAQSGLTGPDGVLEAAFTHVAQDDELAEVRREFSGAVSTSDAYVFLECMDGRFHPARYVAVVETKDAVRIWTNMNGPPAQWDLDRLNWDGVKSRIASEADHLLSKAVSEGAPLVVVRLCAANRFTAFAITGASPDTGDPVPSLPYLQQLKAQAHCIAEIIELSRQRPLSKRSR